MNIKPNNTPGSGKTGSLLSELTARDISTVLGFMSTLKPGVDGEILREWNFSVDGIDCCIRRYDDCAWSASGPDKVFVDLFGRFYERG